MKQQDSWGFVEDDVVPNSSIDVKAWKASVKRHNRPLSVHDCDHYGCKGRYADVGYPTHEWHEIFDDFNLSNRQREDLIMEVVRSRGRTNREAILIRRFISTEDGSYVLRLSNATALTRERYGDLKFNDEQDQIDYYNYCIDSFGFSRELKVGQEDDESAGFFDALDALSWDTDEDDDEGHGSWDDDDEESVSGWGADDDEKISW